MDISLREVGFNLGIALIVIFIFISIDFLVVINLLEKILDILRGKK